MHIEFERSGGFAAILLRTSVDTSEIDAEEARQLEGLVETSGFFNLPERIAPANAGADRFQYLVSVETRGKRHTVQVDESAAPEKLAPLLNHLTMMARTRR